MSATDIIKKSILENFTTDLTLSRILIAMAVAVVLSIYIFYIYRVTARGGFYSKDFNKSIALMSVITAAIVLAMQSNLVISLGMVGALSIVRFRNAVKNSIDIVFLFWSISIGIICGAGLYEIAILVSLVITVLLLVLEIVPSPKAAKLLIVNSSNLDASSEIEAIAKKYASSCRVKSRSLTRSELDLVIEFKNKKDDDADLLREVGALEHVTNVSILAHDGERRF